MSIKLIISDFDGVLMDLKEIHFESLNRALKSVDEKYVISPEEHVKTFDGLSTKRKLKLLSELKDFPAERADEVNALKQKHTVDLLNAFNKVNEEIYSVVHQLKLKGYKFYVASNAIRHTIELGLERLRITNLVDKIYSNEDVINSKPNPEMYLRCMADASVSPSETLIMEDSKHGREAAVKSGAHVCGVDNSFDFTLERIEDLIAQLKPAPLKWAGKSDVTVLIPMAGAGSRFAKQGYKLPKPMIDVNGKPMIQRVIDNLNIDAKYIFIMQKSLAEAIGNSLQMMVPGCTIIETMGLTAGAACTTLLAKEHINNKRHLLIANCDQLVEWNSNDFMYSMLCDDADGGILTFRDNDPKWSYVRLGLDGYACELAEKKVISEHATVGIYYWKHGEDYVRLAEQMIEKNIRVNNEFYVAPVYNEAFLEAKRVKIFAADKMWGIGTPEDLEFYLEHIK